MRLFHFLVPACVGALALVAACDPPNTDTFRRDGGAAPDPTGVMRGTVLYVGPRPECERDTSGTATSIIGVTVLLLFELDNPPPPTGSASSAASLLTVPGASMFTLGDCMPAMPTSADRAPIMRSAPFTWPEIALGTGECMRAEDGTLTCPGQDYQVRAFYDYDGDFLPFYGARNLPTAGDVGGGAFVNASAPIPQPLPIEYGNIVDRPNGQVVEGVAVTLGARVNTERPLFELGAGTRALDSAQTIPIADVVTQEQMLWDTARMRIDAIVSEAMPMPRIEWLDALESAGIDSSGYRFGVPEYGFYVGNVDADSNGMGDLHPILGQAMIPWYTPIILVRRARTAIEVRMGVPDVIIVGTIRPTVAMGIPAGIPKRTMLSFDAIIPPVAVMITNPEFPNLCRVPLIPPGNVAELYEAQWSDCQELPSGNYDVNVLNGIAGGTNVDALERCVADCVAAGNPEATCRTGCAFTVPPQTDTGWLIDGGQFSSQAWSVPNELGCPDTLYRPGAVNQLDPRRSDGTLPECGATDSRQLEGQGRAGGWAIVDVADPDPASGYDATSTEDGRGVTRCQRAPSVATMSVRDVVYMEPMLPECCPPALDQFCGLPLCDTRDHGSEMGGAVEAGITGPYPYPEAVVADGMDRRLTRELRNPGFDYRDNHDGTFTAFCTPFLMPAACCRIAATRAAGP